MSSSGPSMQQVKDSMRTAWMAGDFGVVAKTVSGAGEELINRLDIAPGAHVLDVACGTGNTALPLARRGALVTGVDIAPNLLIQARERAAVEHLDVTFDEGDAEQLPYAESSFDVVVSMFGAMFAPRPELVASEFARVMRPGGLLAMGNWNPDSFSGAMFKTMSRHVPPPPGIAPPVLWGDANVVKSRLEANFHDIKTEIIPIEFDLPMSPACAVTFFRTYFGPTKMAFSRLDTSGQAALAADLESLWASANVAADPTSHTLIHNEYLQVTANRRGA